LSEGDGKVPESLLEGILERSHALRVKKFKALADEIDRDAFDLDDIEDAEIIAVRHILKRLEEAESAEP
jgi:hypothetical protein